MSLIAAHKVTKVYNSLSEGPVQVLTEVDLQIEEGEFLALMGPSGSGKTTLLSILGVLNPLTSGRLLIDDIEVYKLNVERQADFRSAYIGFVFQQFHLVSYLTSLENVLLPLTILRYSHREQLAMASQALARVGLAGKERRLPSQLSGGEQERVAIARAIVNRPPIVYADEPTGSLDSRTGQEIMELFSSLNAEGLTIILVTHNPETLHYVGRVVCLRDGRIKKEEACQAENVSRHLGAQASDKGLPGA